MKTCWSSESPKTIVWAYMPITIEWPEIALRLALTVVAGTLIGLNRSEHGHSAGLRTTLLVCLAASVSMIQVNLLLPIAGKKPDSFAVLDLMRLPLGILSGMGFIGAGAILRKGSLGARLDHRGDPMVCHGLGAVLRRAARSGIGGVSVGCPCIGRTQTPGERLETGPSRHATVDAIGPTEDELTTRFQALGYEIRPWTVIFVDQGSQRQLSAEVRWRARPQEAHSPAFLQSLAHQPGVLQLEWKP
jgi:putative Mg2+ transporter-C (MgtC) family protein